MDLKEIRNKIDKLDEKLINILAERMLLISFIVDLKKKNNLNVFQKEREIELINQKRNLANKLNLDETIILKIFEIILQHSKKFQEENIKNGR